jgi:hypothetical protein
LVVGISIFVSGMQPQHGEGVRNSEIGQAKKYGPSSCPTWFPLPSEARAHHVKPPMAMTWRMRFSAGAEPWQYYDLGHGYCTYTFFEQCPHRMACARCDFYTPKTSSKDQLLEAEDNLQRKLANVPLTEDERAAVDDGQAALDQLLERLADVPTPSGATSRQISAPAQATLLPVIEINRRPT